MIKKIVLVIVFIVITFIVFLQFDNKNEKEKISISYTNDLSGFIFEDIKNDKDNGLDFKEYDFMDLGDCCGSATQFAFATNQIDIAILCPDAIKYLDEIGNNNYIVIGNVCYDSEVLISDKDKSDIKTVGYMNRRNQQKDIFYNYFGENISLVPMSPLSLGYALESNAIDAAYVDMSTYLQLDYEGITITNDNVTQNVVVNKNTKNTEGLKKLIDLYNKKIKDFENEDNLFIFLTNYLKIYDKEEVLKKWKSQKIKFGMLKQEDWN